MAYDSLQWTQHWCLCWRCAGNLACIALAVSSASHCPLHRRCAGVTARVVWASLPSFCWTCHPRCTRIAVSIANWRLPHHNAIMTRQRTRHCHRAHCRCLWFLLPLPAPFPGNLSFMSGQSHAGGFSGVAQAYLPALHWRPCKHCAVIFASVALALSPMLCWLLCPHPAGIAPSIAN